MREVLMEFLTVLTIAVSALAVIFAFGCITLLNWVHIRKISRGIIRYIVRSFKIGRRYFRPMVYVWRHEDIYAVILDSDFERSRGDYLRTARRNIRTWDKREFTISPDPDDVFLFSDKVCAEDTNFVIGTKERMDHILAGCIRERRPFIVPTISPSNLYPFRIKYTEHTAALHIHAGHSSSL